ncbi:MAG TPA: condensation domain-containing protein, partial [Thermoanaerobaculia bacterium]
MLAAGEGVKEAVVVVKGEGAAGKRLVAYVVGRDGAARPNPGQLRSRLGGQLPDYMVPGVVVALERLPLTANGKVDRAALRAMAEPAVGEKRRPSRPGEELLAALWQEVLGIAEVGCDEDFFALGGHSLIATRLMARVRAVFGVELPLVALFEAPTVAALARRLEELGRGEEYRPPPLEAMARDGELPLSFAQQRLWLLEQLAAVGAAYNVALAFSVEGGLSVPALAGALAAAVARHETLRTTFREQEGRPVQVIAPARAAREWARQALVDLAGLGEAARMVEARRLAREEAGRPFSLARGPLLRLVLLRLGERSHWALLVLHHIISDLWSLAVLLRELVACYEAAQAGRPARLPALPVQYVDYAAWQRGWLRGEVLAAELQYWRERLAGAPAVLELPFDRGRPAVASYRGATVEARWAPPAPAALRALCRRHGATLFMGLWALTAALLARLAGQQDVVVGTPVANREQLATEGLIGFFLNTLVLRADLHGEPVFAALVERLRRSA